MLPSLLFADVVGSWLTMSAGIAAIGVGLVASRLLASGTKSQPARVTPSHFIRELPADEPGSEQRVHPRFETRQLKLYVTSAEDMHDLHEGLIVNQSMGGLCFCGPREHAQGTVLFLRCVQAPDSAPWVRIVVRYCRSQRGGWAHGCQLLDGPSENPFHV